MKQSAKYFDSLYALRGAGILCIILYHSGIYWNEIFSNAFSFLYSYGGQIGNAFFFMLSGFLLAYTNREKIQREQMNFSTFIKKRLLKIYPLYFLVNVVCIVVIGIIIRKTVGSLKQIVLNSLLIHWGWVETVSPLNGPCWFLSVIFLCYIIFFFICWISRNNRNAFMYLSLVMFFWGYIILARGIDFPFCGTQNGEGFMNFFFGCFICELYVRLTYIGKKWIGWLSGVILLLVVLLSLRFGLGAVVDDFRVLFTILLCPALLFSSIEIKWVNKILGFKLFTFVGMISMSLMLWHRPLMDITYVWIFRDSGMSNEASFVVYMLILFALCAISYYVFEKYNILYKLVKFLREKSEKYLSVSIQK